MLCLAADNVSRLLPWSQLTRACSCNEQCVVDVLTRSIGNPNFTPHPHPLHPPAMHRVPHECPQEVADIIARCLSRDPEARPSATELVELLQRAPSTPPDGLQPTSLTLPRPSHLSSRSFGPPGAGGSGGIPAAGDVPAAPVAGAAEAVAARQLEEEQQREAQAADGQQQQQRRWPDRAQQSASALGSRIIRSVSLAPDGAHLPLQPTPFARRNSDSSDATG